MRWFNIQKTRNNGQTIALEKATATFNSDPEKYKNTMFCPYCGEPLVNSGMKKRLETLDEHVSCCEVTEKDVYVCNNDKCLWSKYHIWNGDLRDGGAYNSDFFYKMYDLGVKDDNIKLLNQNIYTEDSRMLHSALNSFSATLRNLFDNDGLTERIYLPSWLTFNLIQLTINFRYEFDDFGRTLKTYIKLGYLKKDNGKFNVVGIWPWETWSHLNYNFTRKLKKSKEFTGAKRMNLLLEAFETAVNRSWVYRWYEKYKMFFYKKTAIEVLEYFDIGKFPNHFETYKIIRKKEKANG